MKTETSLQSAYSTFVEQVKSAQVQQVTLKPDRIEYSLKPEFGNQQFYTQPLEPTDDLINLLQSQGVEFNVIPSGSATAANIMGLILSAGAIAGAFAWLLKFSNAGGGIGVGMGMGKSNPRS